jgi:hypothetical protein
VLFSAVERRPPPSESAVWFVVGHMLFQAAFTSGVHTASAIDRGTKWGVGAVAAIAIGGAAAWWANRTVYCGEMLAGELVYRLFMSCYGLIFPAYAWICMLPSWRNPTRPTRRQLVVFAAAVVLAAPFYAVAFLGGRMAWAIPGVAIVLAVPRRRLARVDTA